MASVGDYIFLFIVVAIIGGIVYAVKGSQVDGAVQKQKDAMKAKGIHLSPEGISVKTNKVKVSRDDEITRTQASWAKSGEMMSKHKKAFSYGAGNGETNGATTGTNAKKK